jgi:hypothetical protein
MKRCCMIWMGVCALAPAMAPAQTVQLPTYSFTSVAATVSVPDQGSVLLGGIDREASDRSEFGVPMLPFRPFRNTAIGQSTSAMSTSVTVTIHDFDAMEAALLGGASSAGAAASSPLARDVPRTPAATLAGQWQPKAELSQARSPVADPATEQARRLALRETRASEAAQYFERAEQAEADGKPSVAKIYYQMVVRRADGNLKQQALARLDAMHSAAGKLAQGQP